MDFQVYIGQLKAVCRCFIERIEADKTKIYAPAPSGLWEKISGSPFHLAHEIFFQQDGVTVFDFPGEQIRLFPGDCLLVPQGMPHHEQALGYRGNEFRNMVLTGGINDSTLHIAKAWKQGSLKEVPYIVQVQKLPPKSNLFYFETGAMIYRCCRSSGKSGGYAAEKMTAALLAGLIHDLENMPVPETQPSKLHFKINHICTLLYNALPYQNYSVADLARLVSLSPNYLSNLFRRELGITLKEYINRQKLAYAKSMLETTSRDIAEIAWICGYNDAAYFARLFCRHYGVNPSGLRNK
ncbi:MAG: helix-turn-helix domain-containing protein [Victivallales bacterium]|nr:helix-turn-helix domain-containing protein [Victivallales bacterium]